MGGCFKNVFASIGCLTVGVIAAWAAWHFRAAIAEAWYDVVGSDEPAVNLEVTAGYPSEASLLSARRKENAIERAGGPDRVELTAGEMASLLEDRLDSRARMALDSVRVVLEGDRFSLEGDLLTEVFGRDLLGPLRGIIDPREPIRVSGVPEVVAPGIVAWRIDEFIVSSFPFPGPAIPVLVDRLTGGSNGVVLISVPATVVDLTVEPGGVTFYRRADR